MKTPREILFERHRQAEPKLDAIRRNVLAKLPESGSADALQPGPGEPPLVGALLAKVWAELIWPSRWAWAGMAALWLAVLAANLEMKATSPAAPALRSAHSRELMQAFAEQRRLLAELVRPVNPPPAAPARPNARPRSERPTLSKAC